MELLELLFNLNYLCVHFLLYLEYVGEGGQASVLPLIWKIKQQIGADPTLHPEYPPPLGLQELSRRATELALGRDSSALVENRVTLSILSSNNHPAGVLCLYEILPCLLKLLVNPQSGLSLVVACQLNTLITRRRRGTYDV